MTQSSNINEELLHIRKRARRRLVGAVTLVFFALTVLWTVLDNAPPPQFASGNQVEIVSSAPALAAGKASVVVAVVEPSSGPAYLKPPVDAAEATPVVTPAPVASVAAASSAKPVVTASPAKASTVYRAVAAASSVLPGKLVNHQMPVKPVAATKPKPASTPAVKNESIDPRKILDGLEEAKTASKPTSPTSNKYYLQVGAFADAAKSAQLVTKLKGAGLPVTTEKITTSSGQVLTRIRVGPSLTEARANEWRKKAEAAGVSGKVVR